MSAADGPRQPTKNDDGSVSSLNTSGLAHPRGICQQRPPVATYSHLPKLRY